MTTPDTLRAGQPGVTIIEPVGGHGGCHHYDIPLCRSVRQAGIDATLATCDLTESPAEGDVPVLKSYRGIFGKDPAWRRALRFVRGTLEALQHARRQHHQIIHLHFYGFEPLQVLNVALARLMGFRLVITAHDVESFDARHSAGRAARWTFASADAVIAHNQVTRRELIGKVGLAENKVHVIRHGDHLELEALQRSRADARAALGLAADEFLVVFFGQIKDVKGVDVLIRAAALARTQTQRPLRLLIAGRPWRNDFAPYQALIDELGLRDQVSLHIRFVPDEELPNFYCAADLMALPYRRIYQSGVILMAMALRRPVVVSDLPGMTEMVDDGDNGLVFANGDAAALASQLVWAEAHPQELLNMAERAHSRMKREHGWSLIGTQTAAVYRRIARTSP